MNRNREDAMLTFAEHLLMLTLDEKTQDFIGVDHRRFDHALAGAILMDLALRNRIDTDMTHLLLVDATPTGDDLLDGVLAMLQKHPADRDALWWIGETSFRLGDLKEILRRRLLSSGILLKIEEKGIFGLRKIRWRAAGPGENDIRRQIRAAILSDDIPEPRDIVLVSLAYACNLLERVFSAGELRSVSERIDQFAQMDLIGQAVYQTILKEITIPPAY